MPLSPYNGFSPAQRDASTSWMHLEVLRGSFPAQPSTCSECGQDRGTLSWHSEDYAWPFGPHVVEYPLCYWCHILLHSRFRSPFRWNEYLTLLGSGLRAAPVPSTAAGWASVCRFLGNGGIELESAEERRAAPFLRGLSLERWRHPHADRVMPEGAAARLARELAAARRAAARPAPRPLFAVVR